MKVPFQVAWYQWDTAENVFHLADIEYWKLGGSPRVQHGNAIQLHAAYPDGFLKRNSLGIRVVCHQHCLVQQKVEEQGLAITDTNINLIRCKDGVCYTVNDIVYYI